MYLLLFSPCEVEQCGPEKAAGKRDGQIKRDERCPKRASSRYVSFLIELLLLVFSSSLPGITGAAEIDSSYKILALCL